jgi:hypothetical protein
MRLQAFQADPHFFDDTKRLTEVRHAVKEYFPTFFPALNPPYRPA